MFSYLKNNFIDKNEMLCDELIKLNALDTFKLLNNNKIFNTSSGDTVINFYKIFFNYNYHQDII